VNTVASDSPYPEPLHAVRPLPDHFGVALVLAPRPSARSIASLTIESAAIDAPSNGCEDGALETLRRAIPAAAALPLLLALARPQTQSVLLLGGRDEMRLQIAPP
jgi:hypothetical protein